METTKEKKNNLPKCEIGVLQGDKIIYAKEALILKTSYGISESRLERLGYTFSSVDERDRYAILFTLHKMRSQNTKFF